MNSSIAIPPRRPAAGVLSIVPAQSDSDALADPRRTVATEDSWQLTVTKAVENVDRVPNLTATAFTREGLVSVRAVADTTGAGATLSYEKVLNEQLNFED